VAQASRLPHERRRDARATASDCDISDRVAALEEFETSGRTDSALGQIHRGTAQYVMHVRDQLLRELRGAARTSKPDAQARHVNRATDDAHASLPRRALMPINDAIRRALLAAFPDRLVRRSGPGSHFGKMVGGRGVRVADSSAVRDAALFLAVDVDRGESESLVRLASAVDRDWLPADTLAVRTEVEFDAAAGRVSARRRVYWEDLLLDESPAPLPDGEETAAILAAAVLKEYGEKFDEVFPWDDEEIGGYVKRVRCLAAWMPELELPNFDADTIK
jgi:ATP-dependent helicase HrpB